MGWDGIIIGGGLGGLTAGALCAMAGQRILVVERNAQLGGAATCFARDGRRMPLNLDSTEPQQFGSDPMAWIFAHLGLSDRVSLMPMPPATHLYAPHLGIDLTLPRGMSALKSALCTKFPEQASAISSALADLHRRNSRLAGSPTLFRDPWATKAETVSEDIPGKPRATLSQQLASYFGANTALQIAFTAPFFPMLAPPESLSWDSFAQIFCAHHAPTAQHVHGGTAAMTGALAEIIAEHDGAILTRCAAMEILCDDRGRATGVRLEDGSRHTAKMLFGNAAPQVLVDLLPQPLGEALRASVGIDAPVRTVFEAEVALKCPATELGVPAYSNVLIPDWVTQPSALTAASFLLGDMPPRALPPLLVLDYGQIDPEFRHYGPPRIPLRLTGLDQIENWAGLTEDDFDLQKSLWLEQMITFCEHVWPGFAQAVSYANIVTARSYTQCLKAPGGAVFGLAGPHEGLPSVLQMRPDTVIPGLWLASAYAGSGGFAGAMAGGAAAAASALAEQGLPLISAD